MSLRAVALPGRQHRLSEPQEADLDHWVESIGEELIQTPERPLVLLGHSFGALMAFEVAHWLRANGRDIVKLLGVSSRRAPDMPSRLPDLAGVPDDQLVDWMRNLGGVEAELLACEEMHDIVLPPLRDDLMLDAAYRPRGRQPLDMPVVGLAGRDDPLVDVAEVDGWSRWTTQGFELNVFPGGHFYLSEQWPTVIKLIGDGLAGGMRAVEPNA